MTSDYRESDLTGRLLAGLDRYLDMIECISSNIVDMNEEIESKKKQLEAYQLNKPKTRGEALDKYRQNTNILANEIWALRKQIGAHASVRMIIRQVLTKVKRSNRNMEFRKLPDAQLR